MIKVYFILSFYLVNNDIIWLSISNKDQEPINEEVKQEDRVDGDDIFLLIDNHIHKGNRT